VLDDSLPVGAVDPPGPGGDCCVDDRDVFGERRYGGLWGGRGEKVGGVDSETGEQDACSLEVGVVRRGHEGAPLARRVSRAAGE